MNKRWFKQPQHGYMLRGGETVVTALCLNTAEEQETEQAWKSHKFRLFVNGGCGPIVAEYMAERTPHNPEFVAVNEDSVPAHIRVAFEPYVY